MRLVLNASVWAYGVAVKEEICYAMFIIDQEHKLWAGREADFTSIVDGKHSSKSLHYVGLACDLRHWYITEPDRPRFVEAIEDLLGDGYDVVPEVDHIHIEFQPTR